MVKRLMLFLLLVALMVGAMFLLRNVGKPASEPAIEQPAQLDTPQAPAAADTLAAPDSMQAEP